MEAKAAIVIPTLDFERGAATAAQAMALAGVPCGLVLVVDWEQRGGRLPTNAAFMAALMMGADFVAYLNDDVAITQDGWLARMIEALEEDPHYGIACPSGGCRSGLQSTGHPGDERGVLVVEEPLAWFCAVLRAKMLRKVGLLHQDLYHYACDSEYTKRAQQAGWMSVWVRDVWMEHNPGEPIPEFWEHDRAWYEAHWGKFGKLTKAARQGI